jgi:hypothetical protein
MTKILPAMLFAVLLLSCKDPSDQNILEVNQFYAQNITDGSYYKVTAELLAEGKKCVIWAEKGCGVTKGQAEEIANKYDTVIRPRIADAFAMKNIDYKGYHFDDILDFANWLAGRTNRKLTVLLLDIKDGFKDENNDPYVAGYFDSANFYNHETSNKCDMIYVDTYPGLRKHHEQTYATFAHELQHLINFATTIAKERSSTMDTWIDEGLSSQAEHIYYGTYVFERCGWFSDDIKKTIANGNNFFVWGNHSEEPMAILDDYATVYMFFRWLYLQAGSVLQSSIFYDIETSPLSNHEIVTNVASQINSEWADWDKLLKSCLTANYYPADPVYGYKGDNYFQTIKAKTITVETIPLYPGEGVYSIIKDPFPTPPTSGSIHYEELNDGKSKALLTYNVNTSNSKLTAPETGTLTGVSPSVSFSPGSRMSSNAIQTEQTDKTHTGPYVIDARDFPGRFGRNNSY